MEALAAAAVARFGRIDTWVNNAGVGIYGRLDEVGEEDARRLFDVNFWGVVHGSLVALPHLKKDGGALINLGSEVSDAFMPVLGMYTATKHAVKGFTAALRVEVEDIDQSSVSVTLIQPTAVDTPFAENARNYLPTEPKLPDPKIEPRQVADAILDAAVNPTRDRRVGTQARLNSAIASLIPSLADYMAAGLAGNLSTDRPAEHREGALYEASEQTTHAAGRTHGQSEPK